MQNEPPQLDVVQASLLLQPAEPRGTGNEQRTRFAMIGRGTTETKEQTGLSSVVDIIIIIIIIILYQSMTVICI